MKQNISNLVYRLNVKSTAITHVKGGGHSGSCDVFKFGEIIANISETVQDRDVVTTED